MIVRFIFFLIFIVLFLLGLLLLVKNIGKDNVRNNKKK